MAPSVIWSTLLEKNALFEAGFCADVRAVIPNTNADAIAHAAFRISDSFSNRRVPTTPVLRCGSREPGDSRGVTAMDQRRTCVRMEKISSGFHLSRISGFSLES